MRSILIVCHSNMIASKMAAAYLASRLRELGGQGFGVFSAGMDVRRGSRMPKAAVEALGRMGLEAPGIRTVQVGLKEIRAADLILCATGEIVKRLTSSFISARGKTVILSSLTDRRDVYDPRPVVENCMNCLMMMKPSLDAVADRLVS